ncbi:iws1 family protein, partial [Nannochloropsis gaditana CCMP526]|uniref:iws1 family protein n=1 Tax=Nannochloropsis gaditana (strain CCMP526) TaxID=1093141 RepID=UPI00029F5880
SGCCTMAASRLDYQNLFGSSDEESDGDEGEQQQQSTSTAAPKASSGSSTIKPSALGKSSDDSSSDEDSSEEDEHLSAKKRLQQKGVPLASSSDEESDNEEEGDVPRPAGKARTTGSEALRRATADFDDEEEEEEPRRPNVLPDLSSDGNSSSSGSESESSDDEGDSRRRKRGAEKRKHRLKTKGKRPSKGVDKGRDGRGKAGKQVRDRGQGADEDGGAAAGTGAASEPRRAARELTAVEQALASFKRNRIQKLPDAQVQEMTQHLITLMETAAKEDRQALLQHRPATQKLKRLTEVLDLLRSKHLQGALVDNGQVLGLIRLWLQPLPDKSLPLYAVRTPMIDYLVTARVEVHRLKESGIGRVIQQLKKHPEETVENKAKLTEI